jgi:hypothetical protein
VYVIYKISIEGLGIFFAKESIASFLLPIYLTLTFIPFLYALGLFFVYEELFTRITLIHKKKQKLVKKLKWEIIKKYQFKLKPLVTFSKKLGRDLLELKETEDISELF